MKTITALLLFALTTAGAACSASTPSQTAEPKTLETADAGDEVQGTLNLNIGRTQESSGGLIAGSGTRSDGLIVAPETTGGNFEDVPTLDIQLDVPAGTLLETPEETPSDEDKIVRLPPQN